MDFKQGRPNIGARPGINPGLQTWFRYFRAKLDLARYLSTHAGVRQWIMFEVDCPPGDDSGIFSQYDFWPQTWKNRMASFLVAYRGGNALPMEDPLPLGPHDPMHSGRLLYRTGDLARDTYLAQITHILWLEIDELVPWHLHDYSDHELTYLLSSSNYFRAETIDGQLWYMVNIGGVGRPTENILHDPRDVRAFLAAEPEEQQCLIGDTAAETCSRLTGWFHDYLWHNPGGWDSHQFHREQPLLTDRLLRHELPGGEQRYVTPVGCWSASSLFADLVRSVNIPVRKVRNNLKDSDGEDHAHAGLLFNWQGPGEKRYLLHTDDIYQCPMSFYDPAPAPAGTPRGVALWDHVWLPPGEFGSAFSYSDDPEYVGVATWEQKRKYDDYRSWLMATWQTIRSAGSSGFNSGQIMSGLMTNAGLTQGEAEAAWSAVEATLLSYGNGDIQAGYDALLAGPDSRHCQWCSRTDKCFAGDPCLSQTG